MISLPRRMTKILILAWTLLAVTFTGLAISVINLHAKKVERENSEIIYRFDVAQREIDELIKQIKLRGKK